MPAFTIKHSNGTMALSAKDETEAREKATNRGATNIISVKKTTK